MYPVENSGAAPVLEPATVEQTRPVATGPARQAPLFDDRPKIIPFESIAGRKTAARKQSAVRQRVVRREAQTGTQRIAATQAAQQPLDLRAPAARQRKAVSDDVPVAGPGPRLRAAVLDAVFVAAGIAVAAATFYMMGGRFSLEGKASWYYGAAAASMALFYHLFWCVLGRETAGMQSVGLRLLTFDGHPPTWKRRVERFVLAIISAGAIGIGVLWSLVDEEGLAMHDHISKTFPAEFDPNPSTLRRR
ncbi:MAG: RDD family protein [Acidobacteriota bacterium]